MALRADPSFHDISSAPHRLGRDFTAKPVTKCFRKPAKIAGIGDFLAWTPLSSDRRVSTLCGLQIFERRERAMHGKVAVIDQEFAAHAIGVKSKLDRIARRQISAF